MSAADPSFLEAFAATRAYLLGRPGRVTISPDAATVLFLRSPPRDPTMGLYEYVVATGETSELVTPAELLDGAAEALSDEERARRERLRITDRGFTWFALAPDGGSVLLTLSGRLYLFDRATRRVRPLTAAGDPAAIDPRFSPDGTQVAFVRDNDVWILGLGGAGDARPLTAGGTRDLLHGLAEFVAQEEMARHEGYWFSPDGALLAFAEVDQSAVERFSIADPARPERRAVEFAYPRPGKENARVRLGIVPTAQRSAVPAPLWVRWDDGRYPYLARVLWDAQEAPLAILVQTRDQREAALLAVDGATGQTRPIVVEKDDAWVNLDKDLPRWLPDGSGLLWATERGGARTLELRRPDGTLVRELVSHDFLALVHVDDAANHAFVVTGDALTNRVERLGLRGGERLALTTDAAEHAPVFSRDGSLFVDARVAADALPAALIGGARGEPRGALPDVAEAPPFRPNLQLCRAADFHCAVIRPRDFDPARRYPVIVHVYGGPHALMVKADLRQYLLAQWIADHGAIVVAIDNRGTPRRGRAWERAVKGAFGSLPLDGQVAALEALGRQFPELDLARVGIFGWSFGGYMAALAVLRRPDLFRVAVAGAPVVDWLDYDTHYTERYLDLPDVAPEAYRASSLLTYASALARPLLLIHGTADDNVYFFHSMKLADALLRAGRPFDFLPLPGVTHQIADPLLRARVWERTVGYLLSNLQ